MKKKFWAVSIYQEDARLARWTFDNLEDAIEKIIAIAQNDVEVDKIQIESWHEPM